MDDISTFYHIDMHRVAFQFKIMSLRGKGFYKMDQYLPIEPYPMEKNRGRPNNKRREENEQRLKKLTPNFQEKGYMLHAPFASNKDTINVSCDKISLIFKERTQWKFNL